MATGAASPGEITHAFSLSGGHLAWAIATGKKRMENRQVRFRPGWYGFGVTQTAHTGVMEDEWYRETYPGPDGYPGFQAFYNMRGKVVGACYVSHSLPHEQCKDDDYASGAYPIKNIISKVIPFTSGIPAKGNFGTWPLSIESRDEVRQELRRLLAGGNDVIYNTNGEKDYPEDPTWNGKAKTPYESYGGQAKAPPKAKAKKSAKSASKAQTSTAPKPAKATVTKQAKPSKTIEKTQRGKEPIAPAARKPPPVPRPKKAAAAAAEESDDEPVPCAPMSTDRGDIRSFFGKR